MDANESANAEKYLDLWEENLRKIATKGPVPVPTK